MCAADRCMAGREGIAPRGHPQRTHARQAGSTGTHLCIDESDVDNRLLERRERPPTCLQGSSAATTSHRLPREAPNTCLQCCPQHVLDVAVRTSKPGNTAKEACTARQSPFLIDGRVRGFAFTVCPIGRGRGDNQEALTRWCGVVAMSRLLNPIGAATAAMRTPARRRVVSAARAMPQR